MVKDGVIRWLNLETGLYTEALFEGNEMVYCNGRTTKYEIIEMGNVRIGKSFFKVLGPVAGSRFNIMELEKLEDKDDIIMMRLRRILASLDGGREVYDADASCSGFLYKTMRESEDKVREIRSFLTGFCTDACCECDTCDMYTKLKEEFKEEIK